MWRFKWLQVMPIFLVGVGVALVGCAGTDPHLAAMAQQQAAMSAEPVRVEAVGYGSSSSFEGYTPGQKRLLAIRAARLDAYRALAEQIYGVRVTGGTTVSAMVSQSDSFRSFVDAQLRGARTVTVTPMAEGNYEVVVEMYLNQDFYNSLRAAPVSAPSSLPAQRPTVQGCAVGVNCPSSVGSNYYRDP